ncbi:hypothetical protein EJ110_NYTH51900 [Nymphaea thermarum]|nr:hypothetical protein EJ110_NYTH51900 [Nymphaea thermarum]
MCCDGNGLPLVCTMYASSKCYSGMNLSPLCDPKDVSYTLIPTMFYFEFLPVHRSNGVTDSHAISMTLSEKEQKELVELVNVKLGHFSLPSLRPTGIPAVRLPARFDATGHVAWRNSRRCNAS